MALSTPIRIITTSTQLAPSDTNVIVAFTGVSNVPVTVTLPSTQTYGAVVMITRQDQSGAGPGTVFIAPPPGQTLNNGITQLNLNPGVGMRFIFSSDGWFSSLGNGGAQRWLVAPPGSNPTSNSQISIIPAASNIGSNVIPKNTLYVGSTITLRGSGTVTSSLPNPLSQLSLGVQISQAGFAPSSLIGIFTMNSATSVYYFSFEAIIIFTSSSFIAGSLTLSSSGAPNLQYSNVTINGSIGSDLTITLYHQENGPGGTVFYGPCIMSLMI